MTKQFKELLFFYVALAVLIFASAAVVPVGELIAANMTLAGARKEALKRWPDGAWTLKIDQTKTVYLYELTVIVKTMKPQFIGIQAQCQAEVQLFVSKTWQGVMDASKDIRSTCTDPINVFRK